MKRLNKVIDVLLDSLKIVLVRFREAKLGLLFIVNIFKIPDFIRDKRVNIINKFRLMFTLATAIIYMVSGIDFIPEIIVGIFGLIDDVFILIWSLGVVNEEIEKYKKMIKENKNPNVIEGVDFHIKDEKE